MTLLKERLETAGVNTAEAKLVALAVTALQQCGGSIETAVDVLWKSLVSEPHVIKEMFLRPYLAERQRDMQGSATATPKAAEPRPMALVCSAVAAPKRAPPSPDRQRAVARIVAKAVEIIRFKHTTHDGRDWAEVHAYELASMGRDGALAKAIQSHLGTLTGGQQSKPIGDLMTAATFNKLRETVQS